MPRYGLGLFNGQVAQWRRQAGLPIKFFDTYCGFSTQKDVTDNAYYGVHQADISGTYSAASTGIIPVVAMALGTIDGTVTTTTIASGANDQFLQQIITNISGGARYKEVWLRVDYEVNIQTTVSGYHNGTVGWGAKWKAAFQHASTVLRAKAATVPGFTLRILFDTTVINALDTNNQLNLYKPDPSYYDILSLDFYTGNFFPLTRTPWTGYAAAPPFTLNQSQGAPVAGTLDQWATDYNPNAAPDGQGYTYDNVAHFLTFQDARDDRKNGGAGQSLYTMVQAAAADQKPIFHSECGAIGYQLYNGHVTEGNGYLDISTSFTRANTYKASNDINYFPYLKRIWAQIETQFGVPCLGACIWDDSNATAMSGPTAFSGNAHPGLRSTLQVMAYPLGQYGAVDPVLVVNDIPPAVLASGTPATIRVDANYPLTLANLQVDFGTGAGLVALPAGASLIGTESASFVYTPPSAGAFNIRVRDTVVGYSSPLSDYTVTGTVVPPPPTTQALTLSIAGTGFVYGAPFIATINATVALNSATQINFQISEINGVEVATLQPPQSLDSLGYTTTTEVLSNGNKTLTLTAPSGQDQTWIALKFRAVDTVSGALSNTVTMAVNQVYSSVALTGTTLSFQAGRDPFATDFGASWVLSGAAVPTVPQMTGATIVGKSSGNPTMGVALLNFVPTPGTGTIYLYAITAGGTAPPLAGLSMTVTGPPPPPPPPTQALSLTLDGTGYTYGAPFVLTVTTVVALSAPTQLNLQLSEIAGVEVAALQPPQSLDALGYTSGSEVMSAGGKMVVLTAPGGQDQTWIALKMRAVDTASGAVSNTVTMAVNQVYTNVVLTGTTLTFLAGRDPFASDFGAAFVVTGGAVPAVPPITGATFSGAGTGSTMAVTLAGVDPAGVAGTIYLYARTAAGTAPPLAALAVAASGTTTPPVIIPPVIIPPVVTPPVPATGPLPGIPPTAPIGTPVVVPGAQSYFPGRTLVPEDLTNDRQHRKALARAANAALNGTTNNSMAVTLLPNAGSTTVIDSRISLSTACHFAPQTASAAAELPTMWTIASAGQAVINHTSSAVADRVFTLSIHG